jgi:glyoxylase-like metal-dependent hydrolase (beta-lactamase superfamily II)
LKPLFLLPAAALLLAGCASTPPAPDAATLIKQAQTALGRDVPTLVVSGRGTGGTFGQAWRPELGWPGLHYAVLTRAMNFETGALREDFGRSRSEPNGGGATPLMGQGEARATGFSREGFAWNGGPNNGAQPAPVALQPREHDLWTTSPQGALKAAARYNAVSGTRSAGGQTFNTLSFTAPGKLAATLVLDGTGLITRIESTMPHPVLGDTAVLTEFSDYSDFGEQAGVRFPMRIRQSQGGFPVLDWQVSSVQPGAAVDIAVPDSVRNARENVAVTPVAEGVWFLGGGSHNSVAVELSSQIVLIESPLYDGRALAVFEAANKLVPGKKVATVINSHHHFDHAGGLRAAVGEGAQLITSAMAKPYFERLFANPNRVAPDRLAQSGKAARIVPVAGKTVLSDSLRSIEIHEMQGSIHSQGFLMVWLPKERLLVEADAYTPGPPGSPPPPVVNANNLNLVQNIERLGLNVDRILPLHSRIATMGELLAQVGR